MPEWVIVFLIIAGGLFIAKVLYVIATGWTLPITKGALFVSTPRLRIEAFLDAVPMKKGALFVDLGCGDGRVLRAARKRYGVRALGFEVNPMAWLFARLFSVFYSDISIIRGDFWGHDLNEASFIFCYLFPDVMEKLSEKLKDELRFGAVAVSCNFPLPGWNASEIIYPDSDLYGDPIYIYTFVGS